MKNASSGSPAFAFVIMGVANVLATFVFAFLFFVYKSDAGERYPLLLAATGISFLSGILMFFLYGYFRNKIEKL